MKLTAWISLCAIALPALGDENDRRHKYGDGRQNDGAAYYGDQQTVQQLTPRMEGHFAKASAYFAMGNIPMGMDEQNKGNLLKQQIQENKRTADENRASERRMMEHPDPRMQALNATDPGVLTVDRERQANRGPLGASGEVPESPAFVESSDTPSPAVPSLPDKPKSDSYTSDSETFTFTTESSGSAPALEVVSGIPPAPEETTSTPEALFEELSSATSPASSLMAPAIAEAAEAESERQRLRTSDWEGDLEDLSEPTPDRSPATSAETPDSLLVSARRRPRARPDGARRPRATVSARLPKPLE